ncbi:hypothetical protein [Sodaliphilus pleomorphus]|uniref:Uncharacterized protein n=1 Tax=Sodaliphilus pleomorphus TaxID=2606626 RepID=A0A6L5X9B1_9BACT|nr:hypothetical protein [Sodaliphilus pleomorphus]MSS16831.1 hypothetical protein [Sodaliphilus pleomorphus]
MRTTKKDFDKFLTRLFAMQRDCFKQGSKSSLEVRPKFEGDFVIYVTATNENVNRFTTDEDGKERIYHFDMFQLYQFLTVEENELTMQKIKDFLTDTGDEQH